MPLSASNSTAQAGFTLPVFACAAAIAALHCLRGQPASTSVTLDLIEPAQRAEIPIAQVAPLPGGMALAIAHSDPGDNLDLTRHTPVWALVTWGKPEQSEPIEILGGEGIGRQLQANNQPAIYRYAQTLLRTNLERLLSPGETLQVTIILPEGRALAERTSNAAFGVVEGLSLLGTSGISQPLSAPGQLEVYRTELQQKAAQFETLVFCVGENGLDFARQLGIDPQRVVKTANWLGPLLVEAGLQGVQSLVLFGYHGKLLKLAGGIFHTHHHVADGRREILTAQAAHQGLPTPDLQALFACETAESALTNLQQFTARDQVDWVVKVYGAIAQEIDRCCQDYIYTHSQQRLSVGSVLFDRQRQIIIHSATGRSLMKSIC